MEKWKKDIVKTGAWGTAAAILGKVTYSLYDVYTRTNLAASDLYKTAGEWLKTVGNDILNAVPSPAVTNIRKEVLIYARDLINKATELRPTPEVHEIQRELNLFLEYFPNKILTSADKVTEYTITKRSWEIGQYLRVCIEPATNPNTMGWLTVLGLVGVGISIFGAGYHLRNARFWKERRQ